MRQQPQKPFARRWSPKNFLTIKSTMSDDAFKKLDAEIRACIAAAPLTARTPMVVLPVQSIDETLSVATYRQPRTLTHVHRVRRRTGFVLVRKGATVPQNGLIFRKKWDYTGMAKEAKAWWKDHWSKH